MASVCPFAKATRSGDSSVKKQNEDESKSQGDGEDKGKSCPVAKFHNVTKTPSEEDSKTKPLGDGQDKAAMDSATSGVIPAKCPYGFDSQTFKIGPFSCVICQALLYNSSRCVPCSHVFCYACVSRFKDCPLCGADIEKIEADSDLQAVVDRFIDGHARIKRSVADIDAKGAGNDKKTVTYEDVSLERGAFLVQHAMRAFRAQNIESAKSRLYMCSEDIREQLKVLGTTSELCSQLGAVLGMLGDCCRALGESDSAICHYEESVEFLQKLPVEDHVTPRILKDIVQTLSVSLNKIGDLKYYGGDLQSARSYYFRSLNVRREAAKLHGSLSSQVLDVAVSLAKVADIDRNLGNEDTALEGFQEGLKLLESLTLSSDEVALEQKRTSVVGYLTSQLAEKQPAATE